MYPQRLILENFGPFEQLSYDFVHEPIAVIGENRTQDDQISNGSGKSFMEQGLFYGIYGTNLRGTLDRKLVQLGADSAFIQVRIYCPIRKKTLEVTRTIPIKGSAKLSISLIDEDENIEPVNFATVNDGNKYVANWIEISAEDAKSYYIISKGNYKSFFAASNTEKLALISRFINFSRIDQTKDVIDKEVGEINASKLNIEMEHAALGGKINVYNEQLQELKDRDVEEERKQAIDEIEEKIASKAKDNELWVNSILSYEDKIAKAQKTIEENEKLKEQVEEELKGIDLESFKTIYQEIREDIEENEASKRILDKDLRSRKDELRMYNDKISKIENLLAGVIVCPKCHHEFILKCDESVDELKVNKKKITSLIEENNKQSKKIEESIRELEEILDEYKEVQTETSIEERGLIQRQSTIRQKMSTLERERISAKNSIEYAKAEIDLLEKKIIANEKFMEDQLKLKQAYLTNPLEEIDTSEVEEKIKKTEEELKKKEKEIINKNNDIFKVQCWTTRFKEFKMYLAMEQIKNIQIKANEILKSMGSDLRIMIEGFKLDSKGNAKEEITPYVFRDEMESFYFYSGGEQARVEIALILAIQQMINATKTYSGMNFLLVDEVLESCDPLGVENIISSMNFLKQSVIIITHVPKLNEEIRQIKIIKENGVSHLEE